MSKETYIPYISGRFHVPKYDGKNHIQWFSEEALDVAGITDKENLLVSIQEECNTILRRIESSGKFDFREFKTGITQKNIITLALCAIGNIYYVYDGSRVTIVRFMDLDTPLILPYDSDSVAMSFTMNKIFSKNNEYHMVSQSFLVDPKTLDVLDETEWYPNRMYTSDELDSRLYLSGIIVRPDDYITAVLGRPIEIGKPSNFMMYQYTYINKRIGEHNDV